jgi:perosamine synthetase
MSAASEQFLVPAEQHPSARSFAFRRTSRLPGISQSSPRHLFFWARNAIYHSLTALDIQRGDSLLVPAYICTAAVEPIEAFGARVVYYEVGQDCLPDLSDLEAKIDARTRAILAVHYFGFPCGIRKIRKICDQRGLYLIEDCAHVLQGEEGGQPLGTFGDVSVFSWRKFLPIYDGGELILNRCKRQLTVDRDTESLLFTMRVAKNLLERGLPRSLASALAAVRPPHASPTEPPAAASSPASPPAHGGQLLHVYPNSISFEERMVNFPISRLSRLLLDHCLMAPVIEKRRANFAYLQHELAGLQGVRPLFESLPDGVCPWVCPIFFVDRPNGQFPLRRLGIPAASWGGVRHPGISAADFPSADFLYENLVFLPIHQDLRTIDLNLIVEAVKAVLEGR